MSTLYPAAKQTFTDPAGTSLLTGVDHAQSHTNINDTLEAVQDTIGTTLGTNVLKNFAAGNFPARVNAGGTIVQTLIGGTIDQTVLGTPAITGGTSTSTLLTTPTFSAGAIPTAAIADGAITGRKATSGMYRAALSQATVAGTAFADVTSGSIASVAVPVISDVEIDVMIDYAQNNVTGNGQNVFQVVRDSTAIGAEVFQSIGTVNHNYFLYIKRTIEDLAVGTYTFKVQGRSNTAGTMVTGTGEISVKVRAAGV